MALAEDQMKTLSRQMEELNRHMKRLSDREQDHRISYRDRSALA
jgi:hypothetical protein